jgi:hypothetical protein
LQGIGPLTPNLPSLPKGVAVQPKHKHMKRLQAKRKGKDVTCPVGLSEGGVLPPI